jgi:hypothetical protein
MRIRDSTYHPDADPDSYFYLMRISRFLYGEDRGPESEFHPDADPDPSLQIKSAQIGSYFIHFGLSYEN